MHDSYNYPKELLSEYRSEVQDSSQELPEDVRKSVDNILENLYEDSLELSAVKSASKMNGDWAGKFSMYTGLSPKQFIIHHRIEAGKILLRKTSLNLAQISLLVGYSSLSSFSKTFKNNNEGVNPSAWRRKNSS